MPLLLALMALTSCHPYLNTFYNAEEAYASAQRKHIRLMRNFPDSLVVKPTDEMAASYDRAIKKSLKMMEVYPRDRKYQDRAHYLMGRASYYKMDFPVCLGRMRDLQTDFPESPLVPPSMIYVAKAHIMMDNLALAEEILLELLKTHPRLDRDHEITMLLVEIAMRRGGRSQALLLLEGMRKSALLPLDKRLEIILKMADLNYELRQYDNALALLRAAPRSKKYPLLMFRVDRSIYYCLDAMDSFDAALAHLGAMRKNRWYAEQKYEIMYYKAVTLRRMGRMDEALALFNEIRAMCGRVAGKSDTLSLCGRTAYELAQIYQSLGEYEKAEAAFGESVKFGAAGGGKASVRLWALNRLKELRTPDSSGNVTAEARYSVAELFRFELEAPDSAYYYYIELAADTAAADSVRPRSLLSAAIVARYQMADSLRADSLLNLVAAGYGGTEYARRAQIELDVEVTVVTEREVAEREFRNAESMLENDPVEAVKAFYNVYVDHPGLDIAARSLHAAAWYTDNILQRNRAALTLYEELCDKYPESRYCKSSASSRVSVARDSMEVRKKRREAAKAEAEASGAEVPSVVDDIEPDLDQGTGKGPSSEAEIK